MARIVVGQTLRLLHWAVTSGSGMALVGHT